MLYDSHNRGVRQFLFDMSNERPITRPPAEFGESFAAEVSHFWRENLSISRDIAMSRAMSDRAQKVRELAGNDAFIKAIGSPGDPATQRMIEELGLESDESLFFGIKERNRELRAERDAALQYQTTGGKIGGFLGTMTGAMSDPLVLGTMPLGASWATGIVKTMLIEAGLGAGVEAAIQAPVLRYKNALESPYTVGEAALNVAAAGIGSGLLTGAVKLGARELGALFRGVDSPPPRIAGFDDLVEAGEKVTNPTTEQTEALRVLREHADNLRQSPFEPAPLPPPRQPNQRLSALQFMREYQAEQAAKRAARGVDLPDEPPFDVPNPALDDIHLSALAKAQDDITNGRPVDVSEHIPQAADEPPMMIRDLDAEEETIADAVIKRQANDILTVEDVRIPVESAEGVTERSARGVMQELDDDSRLGRLVRACVIGGGE